MGSVRQRCEFRGRAVSDLFAMTSDWKPAAAEADRLTGMFAVVAPLPLLKAAILFLTLRLLSLVSDSSRGGQASISCCAGI